eukprot:4453353-Prymnesium_polylepis.1
MSQCPPGARPPVVVCARARRRPMMRSHGRHVVSLRGSHAGGHVEGHVEGHMGAHLLVVVHGAYRVALDQPGRLLPVVP